MKRTVSITLALLFLISCFVLPASAATLITTPPAGTAAGMETDWLTTEDYLNENKLLTGSLTSNTNNSKENGGTYNGGSKKSSSTLLSDEVVADMADMSKYTFTVIGIDACEKSVLNAVDGDTSSAVNWYFDEAFYDKDGNANTTATDAYRYNTLMTMDFGVAKELNVLTFVVKATKIASLPQAGDVYVSADGENWTLLTYWDIPTERMNNTWNDANLISTTLLANQSAMSIGLGGAQARYVRVAFTAGKGKSSPSDANVYDNYLNNKETSLDFRDMQVYGNDVSDNTIKIVGAQDTLALGNDTYDIRFLATVNTLNVNNYGFKVTVNYTDANGNQSASKTYSDTTVFTSVQADGKTKAAPFGTYYGLLTITGIPKDVTVTFSVTPFLTLEDSSTADGTAFTYTVPANS